MKTLSLFSAALAVTSVSAAARPKQLQARAATCGVAGTDFFNSVLSIDATGKKASLEACSAACLATTACNAFSFGLLTCTLYKSAVTSGFFSTFLSIYTFYDRACVAPGGSTTAAPAPTTTAPTTTLPNGGLITSAVAAVTTASKGGITTLSALPTGTAVCVASAVPAIAPAPLTCGVSNGGTATTSLSTNNANSLTDCAVNCAANLACQSFGYYPDGGLCTLYAPAVASLSVQPNYGVYSFYDAACFLTTFCAGA